MPMQLPAFMWQCHQAPSCGNCRACCDLHMQVAEAALCVLHTLLTEDQGPQQTRKRVLCHAVVAADLHQPLLALLHTHPTSMGSSTVPSPLALAPHCIMYVFLA